MAGKAKFTQQQVIDALRETKGMVYLAADRLGCEAQTIYNYRDRYPAIKAEMEAQDGKIDDIAEMKLYQALLAGESWAVQFRLRTKAKHRGYVEKSVTEVTGTNGGPVEVATLTNEERIARLAELFDAARTRRNRRSPE